MDGNGLRIRPREFGATSIGRESVGSTIFLPKPHCDPFRWMIDHPTIVQRLNWMLGTGFKEFFEPMCCVYPKGTAGGSLHGQVPGDYAANGGFPWGESVNVAWSLTDESPGSGTIAGVSSVCPAATRRLTTSRGR